MSVPDSSASIRCAIIGLDRRLSVGTAAACADYRSSAGFLPADEVVRRLLKNPGFSEQEAASLMHQVESHDYSPPTRRRVLEWQQHQDFPTCPNPGDPDGCNVYRDLVFPDSVYERIEDYHCQKVRPQAVGKAT